MALLLSGKVPLFFKDSLTTENNTDDKAHGYAGVKASHSEPAGAASVKKETQTGEAEVAPAVAAQNAAKSALMRLAARFLVRETVRGKVLDPVGNFHVR